MPIPAHDLILVVDDNDANRYVLARLLTKAGYEVIEAQTLAAADEMLQRAPALIVLDVNLPDGKGTRFAKRIKSSPATAQIMVLNMSASFTRTKDRIEGLDSGADGYLVQPIDPPEFLATVKSLLRISHAETAVRQKNRDLELFAYAISHDLQEPLRMVSSFLELLTHRSANGAGLDEKQTKYVTFARSAAQRMRIMIGDLMSLTQAQQSGLKSGPVEMAKVVESALNNLSIQVKDTAPEVVIGALPTVPGDSGLLTQVLQNLLSNAMKYRSDRPLRIDISCEKMDDSLVINVRDNGIGIPTSQIDTIFAIFKRLHSHSEIPGSGIGLALCKKIVEMHGGHIGCSSTKGVGSQFWFSLPLDQGTAIAQPS